MPDWLHIVPRRAGNNRPEGVQPTHDAFVDSAFWVAGPPRALAALLRHPVRSGLLTLRNVTVCPGTIESRCTASRLSHVERWFDGVLRLAHQLADQQPDLDRGLLEVLRDDPNAVLRQHVLRLLNEPRVSAADRERALHLGLQDADPAVRCFAALRVESEVGLAELRGLVSGYAPEDVRLSALHGLMRVTPGVELVPLLVHAAAGPEGRLSRRAMSWAIAYGGNDALKAIVARPRLPLSGLRSALDVARRRRASCLTPELLDMLEWEGASDERRLIAIQGLGAVGSLDAVLALKQVAREDVSVAASVRMAIAEIQNRYRSDSAGALSIANNDRGQLTLAEPGGLSLPDESR